MLIRLFQETLSVGVGFEHEGSRRSSAYRFERQESLEAAHRGLSGPSLGLAMPAQPIANYSKRERHGPFDGSGSNLTQHMALPETTGQAEASYFLAQK